MWRFFSIFLLFATFFLCLFLLYFVFSFFFFFQAEDGIRDPLVTGVQTCALPISAERSGGPPLGIAKRRHADRDGTHFHLLHFFTSAQKSDCSESTSVNRRVPGARRHARDLPCPPHCRSATHNADWRCRRGGTCKDACSNAPAAAPSRSARTE